jgi:hypothetical protein
MLNGGQLQLEITASDDLDRVGKLYNLDPSPNAALTPLVVQQRTFILSGSLES